MTPRNAGRQVEKPHNALYKEEQSRSCGPVYMTQNLPKNCAEPV